MHSHDAKKRGPATSEASRGRANRRLRALAGAALALPLLAAGACNREAADTSIATPTPAPAAPAAPAAPGAASPTKAGALETHRELPGDVPLYPGAKISDRPGKMGETLTFTTTDSAEKVAAFYTNELEDGGWVVQQAPAGDDVALFADKETRSVSLVVSAVEGETEVSVLVLEMK